MKFSFLGCFKTNPCTIYVVWYLQWAWNCSATGLIIFEEVESRYSEFFTWPFYNAVNFFKTWVLKWSIFAFCFRFVFMHPCLVSPRFIILQQVLLQVFLVLLFKLISTIPGFATSFVFGKNSGQIVADLPDRQVSVFWIFFHKTEWFRT